MSKKKSSKAKMPTAAQLEPMLALQRKYSQVGVSTPFGSQQYVVDPTTGQQTLQTTLSPQAQGLVDRSMMLAGTDSEQQYVPGQVNDIAGALANRVGARFGLPSNQAGMRLGPTKPPMSAQSLPPAQNIPPGG